MRHYVAIICVEQRNKPLRVSLNAQTRAEAYIEADEYIARYGFTLRNVKHPILCVDQTNNY